MPVLMIASLADLRLTLAHCLPYVCQPVAHDMYQPAKPDTTLPVSLHQDYVNIRYPGGKGILFSSACAVNGLPAAGKSVRRGSS